jgi:citrate lyase subunit beta/citryl-CoA lyase
MHLFRSLLFVPGNREDMLAKVKNLQADALVPDMEDSVPVSEKEHARELVSKTVKTLARQGQAIIPRINALNTGLAHDDLTAVVSTHIYGVSVGKIESAWDIREICSILDNIESQSGMTIGHTRIIPWLETSKGIVNAYQIASASTRIIGVAFGAEDFTNDMDIQRSDEGIEVAYPRAVVAVAARAAGVLALDTPQVNFRDSEGLKQQVQSGRALGFKGKFAIHPSQLDTINTMFSPSPEEIEYAKKVVAAFEEAEARGSGATSIDGKMIDVPIVKRALSLLGLSESIARRAN